MNDGGHSDGLVIDLINDSIAVRKYFANRFIVEFGNNSA